MLCTILPGAWKCTGKVRPRRSASREEEDAALSMLYNLYAWYTWCTRTYGLYCTVQYCISLIKL